MRVQPTKDGGRVVEGDTPYLRFRVVDGVVEVWEPREPETAESDRVTWREAAGRVVHGAAGLVKLTIGADAASRDVVAARVQVCDACPELTDQRRCGSLLKKTTCGCYVDAKARIASERCPLGKW